MSLQNEIMNIPLSSKVELGLDDDEHFCYASGFIAARRASAELSLKYDHLIEELSDHFGTGIVDMFKRKCGV